MYMVVEKEDYDSLNEVVESLVEEQGINTIYYDTDKVKPENILRVNLIKNEDVFSSMLSCEDKNCLYICSTSANKFNPVLQGETEVQISGKR